MIADRLRRIACTTAPWASGRAACSAIRVTLHESHIAWASYERAAVTAVHVVAPGRRRRPARAERRQRLRPPHLPRATLPRLVHLCEHDRRRHTGPIRTPAALAVLAEVMATCPTAPLVLVDGLIASAACGARACTPTHFAGVLVHMPFGASLATPVPAQQDSIETRRT